MSRTHYNESDLIGSKVVGILPSKAPMTIVDVETVFYNNIYITTIIKIAECATAPIYSIYPIDELLKMYKIERK